MLDIKIEGDKVIIDNLQHLKSEGMVSAILRGLERIGKGIFREAYAWLSGAKGNPGSYPIPVVRGWLRRQLNWLKPGESKTGEVGTFTAGNMETVIYDAAIYADPVFHGKGSSAKYGERDALKDALRIFNQGDRIKAVLEEEIGKEIKK